MAETEKRTAAVYVSWGTFTHALEQLSQAVPPNRLDRTVFPGMAWAIQNQLFSGLRFLGLMDDKNRPTADLEALATTDEVAKKAKLGEILRNRYADLFALDLKKTTPGELAQKMSDSYGANGDTREKAVRFFLNAAEYVGIELSPLFEQSKKSNNSSLNTRSPRKKPPRRPRSSNSISDDPTLVNNNVGTSKTIKLQSGGTLTLVGTLDLFSLNPADRKFVFELIDKLDQYNTDTQAKS